MKIYRRRFRMAIDLDLYTRYADEVVDSIENDTINVVRPDDEHALDCVRDTGGALLIDAGATMPVSIREWLPVVCQFIRWEELCSRPPFGGPLKDSVIAYYDSNEREVLWPTGGLDPAGPGALIAGVVLRRKWFIDDRSQGSVAECGRLMFTLAHELVHVIHSMVFVVPAFLNWRVFWRKVLDEGVRCDILGANDNLRNGFVDRYGSELELAEVMRFWPSRGRQWFDTFQRSISRRRGSGKTGAVGDPRQGGAEDE